MGLIFYKYQATGNDFILIDDRLAGFDRQDVGFIAGLCDRRFGIGADGLILLAADPVLDFRMYYFNADGKKGSMCGNGGRCIVHFAKYLQLIREDTQFRAPDGLHRAKIKKNMVDLQMRAVKKSSFKKIGDDFFVDTGSPHCVRFTKDVAHLAVSSVGKKLRYAPCFEEIGGTNVNFVEVHSAQSIRVRTYERGVEAETYSCGTGVTAAALCLAAGAEKAFNRVWADTKGGTLEVSWTETKDAYDNIFLKGDAKQVFRGEI